MMKIVCDIAAMRADSTTDNFVREFITSLRYKYNKEYRITWTDIKHLFGDSVDPMVADMDDIWGSDKKFEWMIDDISRNFISDFKRQKFLVNIAKCRFDDGKYAVLSIGGGDEHFSRNAFLSFYNTELEPIWRCQICIDQKYQHDKWQAGTVRMGWKERRGGHIIASMHMKSVDNNKVSEMLFNGNLSIPYYAHDRGARSGSSIGFTWDEDTDTIWENALDHEDGDTYYTIAEDFFDDFPEEHMEFDDDVYQMNPQNMC
jgi:hypothetical protein